jgi:hypothetical protein
MANDIQLAISGAPIKNGTLLVTCGRTGFPTSPTTIKYNRNVVNSPTLTDIQAKYDVRFDDPRYYFGNNN